MKNGTDPRHVKPMANWTVRAAALLVALPVAACGDWLTDQQGSVFGGGSTSPVGVVSTGGSTVSGRISQLRADQNALTSAVQAQTGRLQSIRNTIGTEARGYNGAVSQIASRLQVGVGDERQFRRSRGKLECEGLIGERLDAKSSIGRR